MMWLLVVYLIVLTWFALGFLLSPRFQLLPLPQQTPVSIVICARNEERTIVKCLQSLLDQDYPKELIELIVIDDASTDTTFLQISEFIVQSSLKVHTSKSYTQRGKKQCLAEGIDMATHPLVICRDADTYTESTNWLSTLVQYHERTNCDVLIGPIALQPKKNYEAQFQSFENNTLRVIGAGAAFWGMPFLASGANFSFTKKAYTAVGGYANHLHIASGDDIYFLQEAAQLKHLKIGFVNSAEALVYTYPSATTEEALLQRIRWSGKLLKRPHALSVVLGLLILAVNAVFTIKLIALPKLQTQVLLFLGLKAGFDFLLLLIADKGFGKTGSLVNRLLFIIAYPIFMVASGFATLFVKPKWK